MKLLAAYEELAVYLSDIFASIGKVSYGRFFSGYGLKVENVQFAMILKGTLYMCADEALATELKQSGSTPFIYSTKVRTVTVGSYYSIPGELLDDTDQMLRWAKASLEVAREKAKKKNAKRKNKL